MNPRLHRSADYYDTRAAALYLSLSPRTLEKWRLSGEGPSYFKRGRRCLYRLEDLDAWAEAGRRDSTSAHRGVRR